MLAMEAELQRKNADVAALDRQVGGGMVVHPPPRASGSIITIPACSFITIPS